MMLALGLHFSGENFLQNQVSHVSDCLMTSEEF